MLEAKKIEEGLLYSAAQTTEKEAQLAVLPTKKVAKAALERASLEIKYVFGILGFTPQTFIELVNKAGFETLNHVFDKIDNLEDLDD